MRINFVSRADSSMASHRFRAVHPVEVLQSRTKDIEVTIKRYPDLDADINFYQKHIDPQLTLHWLRTIPTKSVFDVCDDHFDRELGAYYKSACEAADVVSVTNTRMVLRINELFPDKPVCIMDDPVNTLKGSPKWSPNPKIVWFGHSTNFQNALSWLCALEGADVTVITNQPLHGYPFKYIPYSAGVVEKELRNFDIVLLPQNDLQPWNAMKSPNRFVDAVNAGCCVVGNRVEPYIELYRHTGCVVTSPEGLKEFLDYYANNEKDVIQKIENGQKYVNSTFNDDVLYQQIMEIINACKS